MTVSGDSCCQETGEQVRTFCSLNQHALKHRQHRELALWHLARLLDDPDGTGTGKGWVYLEYLIATALALGWWTTEKSVRNILQSGMGTWWYPDTRTNDRIFIHSPKHLHEQLEIAPNPRIVLVSLDVFKKQRHFKQALYASKFKEGGTIITRASLMTLTGLSKTSQHKYEKEAGIRKEPTLRVAAHHEKAEDALEFCVNKNIYYVCLDCGFRTIKPEVARQHKHRMEKVADGPNRYYSPLREAFAPALSRRVRRTEAQTAHQGCSHPSSFHMTCETSRQVRAIRKRNILQPVYLWTGNIDRRRAYRFVPLGKPDARRT